METREQRAIRLAVESITANQRMKIITMLKTHKRADIAKEIGVSESKLKRIAKGSGFEFSYAKARPYGKYSKELTIEVIDFFESNGIKKTIKKFPDVKIRSVIEHYPRKAQRQRCWTDEEIIQAIRFGPFMSLKNQAAFFGRPLAYEGSIKSLWSKRIKGNRRRIHGLPRYIAKDFVNSLCPVTPIKMRHAKDIYLWCDMEAHLLNSCPEFFKKIIEAGSMFQRNLYGNNVKQEIDKILNSEAA